VGKIGTSLGAACKPPIEPWLPSSEACAPNVAALPQPTEKQEAGTLGLPAKHLGALTNNNTPQ
jgi:hypothetical protein